MNILTKMRYMILAVGFLALTNKAAVSGHSSGAHLDADERKCHAYFLVTGPNLDDKMAKKTVHEQMTDLGILLSERSKASDVFLMDKFDMAEMRKSINGLKNKYGSDHLHITCIINSHGYNRGGKYFAQTHRGCVSDDDLKALFGGVQTSLSLLTCHAGAFANDSASLEVFGASSGSMPMYEYLFVLWLKAVEQSASTLKTANDFMETWGATLEALKVKGASYEFPFWSSTREKNAVTAIYGPK